MGECELTNPQAFEFFSCVMTKEPLTSVQKRLLKVQRTYFIDEIIWVILPSASHL